MCIPLIGCDKNGTLPLRFASFKPIIQFTDERKINNGEHPSTLTRTPQTIKVIKI